MDDRLEIQLLGGPSLRSTGGEVISPRGKKAWGLLTYLLQATVPPTRAWLAELLFADADDPLATLRWNLSELRRALPGIELLGGDPVRVELGPAASVDLRTLIQGSWLEAVRLPGLGEELLAGLDFSSTPAFDAWLTVERRRVAGTAAAVLLEAANARLAGGDAIEAARLAQRLVASDPFDEDGQELLIRALAATGDRAGAARHLATTIRTFKEELDVEPGPGVMAALDSTATDLPGSPVSARAAARSQLDAGEAAIAAGAVAAGIACLRRAVLESDQIGDTALKAQALVALGAALIHSVRGRDGEATALLHEAANLAEGAGDHASLALAHRELGYSEHLRARYDRAERWLLSARRIAADANLPVEVGWADALLGDIASDQGRYHDALAAFRRAAAAGTEHEAPRLAVWAQTFGGRAHLLRRELPEARRLLETAVRATATIGWRSFAPLPSSLLAEVDLLDGQVDAAGEAFELAFADGCQLGDPCWEGIAQRGMGLVASIRGDREAALEMLSDAARRCVRLPDTYLWIRGYCLDALADHAVRVGAPEAARAISDLELLASRSGMHELMLRASLHRVAAGGPKADEAESTARALAAEIDNPALAVSVVL